MLLAVAVLMVFGLTTRSTLDVNLLRDRNPLFVTLSDGSVRNGYTFKIMNRARALRDFTLTVEGIEGASFSVLGGADDVTAAVLKTEPDRVETYRVFVRAPRPALAGESTSLRFVLRENRDAGGEQVVQDNVFRGPKR